MRENLVALSILFSSLSIALFFYFNQGETYQFEESNEYEIKNYMLAEDTEQIPEDEPPPINLNGNERTISYEKTKGLFNFSSSTEKWTEHIKFREISPSNDMVATVITSERPRTGAEIMASADRKSVATIERIDIFTPQTGTTTIADTSFDKLGVSNYFRPVFSPDGAFLFVTTRHYEGESSFYFERETGKIMNMNEIVFQGDWQDRNKGLNILWSPDTTKMIVRSTGSNIGYGHRAVYYSKTGRPDDLEVILDFDKAEREAQENNSVYLLDIFDTSITNEQFNFTAFYSDESLIKSSYIFKTGEILTY